MALPTSLSTTRISGSSAVSGWPTSETALEQSICDILGVSINTSYTVAAIVRDAAGRITNTPEIGSAPPAALRLRDTTNNKEFRIASNNGVFTIDENTGSEGTPTWVARLTINAGSSFGGGGTLYSEITDSSAITNTVTLTTFDRSFTIPANTLAVGDVIRITATFNPTAYATGTLFVALNWINNTHPVSTSGIYTPIAGGFLALQTNIIVRSIGGSGSIIVGGGAPSWTFNSSVVLLNNDIGAPITTDTTAGITVGAHAQWSAANAGNSVKMVTFFVERLPAASTS